MEIKDTLLLPFRFVFVHYTQQQECQIPLAEVAFPVFIYSNRCTEEKEILDVCKSGF